MYLMTASLLNSWKNLLDNEFSEMEDFLKVLHRKPIEKTEPMMKGDIFEQWAANNIPELQGAVRQAALYGECGDYLLYGKLDFLKAGIIYDAKYTGRYEVGKFFGSPQTSMYFTLVPEAFKFVYIISNSEDGKNLWREEYLRDEVVPISVHIGQFESWLQEVGLFGIYREVWATKR